MALIDPQPVAAFGMTPAEAMEILKQPLVFGDPQQLAARAIMQQIDKAAHALLKCSHDYARRKTLCCCVSQFDQRLVRAALSKLEDRRLGSWGQNSISEVRNCL